MTTTSIKLFALSMEMLDVDTVNLEQDAGYGQVDQVQLHRSQVVLLAQQFGLIGQCDVGTVTRLQRHLLLLNTKAEQLADWLLNVTSDRHQDLSTERAMAMALSDFAAEFVADFHVVGRPSSLAVDQVTPSDATQTHVTPAKTTKNGGLEEPQKRGSSMANATAPSLHVPSNSDGKRQPEPQQPDLLEQPS